MKINRIYGEERQAATDMLERRNLDRFLVRRRAQRRRELDQIAERMELPTREGRGGWEEGVHARGPKPSSRRSMAGRLLGALAWALLFAALIVVIWLGRNGIWGS